MKTAVVWSQPNCKYCTMAKQLLLSKGYSYTEKKIGEGEAYKKKDLLAEVPNARSVPQIFLDGKYIGGYEDLVKAL
jgi:glutaredoxin 3